MLTCGHGWGQVARVVTQTGILDPSCWYNTAWAERGVHERVCGALWREPTPGIAGLEAFGAGRPSPLGARPDRGLGLEWLGQRQPLSHSQEGVACDALIAAVTPADPARMCNDAWRANARFHVIGLAERTTRSAGNGRSRPFIGDSSLEVFAQTLARSSKSSTSVH